LSRNLFTKNRYQNELYFPHISPTVFDVQNFLQILNAFKLDRADGTITKVVRARYDVIEQFDKNDFAKEVQDPSPLSRTKCGGTFD